MHTANKSGSIMKKLILICAIIIVAVSASFAGESSCPADRASAIGYNPFGDFHHIMAPVWHTAWAEKDFKTLLEAGPQFERLFVPIAKMEPKLKSDKRNTVFKKNREAYAQAVQLFADACKAGDKDKAYELMPGLHDTFEMTASSLLPLHYPEFDGFVISFNLLNENHIPTNNIEGINGTVETLISKLDGLNEKTIPAELADVKEDMVKEFGKIKEKVALLKECCDKKEMKKLESHAKELSTLLDEFVLKFI